MQANVSIGAAVAIHGDVVELIGHDSRGQLTKITLRKGIVVVRDQGQIGHAVSRVNGEQGVEVRIRRGKKQRAVDRGTQLIPDRMPALIAGVKRFARLACGALVDRSHDASQPGQFNSVTKIVVRGIDETNDNDIRRTDITGNVLREGAHRVCPGGQQELAEPVRGAGDRDRLTGVDLQEDLADAGVVEPRVFRRAGQSDRVGGEERFTRRADDGRHRTVGVRQPSRCNSQADVPHPISVVPRDRNAVGNTCSGVKIHMRFEPIHSVVGRSGDRLQIRDSGAGVNRQHRVERAARQIDKHIGINSGGPCPPNRGCHSGHKRVQRLARLHRSVIVGRENDGAFRCDFECVGEVVVGRSRHHHVPDRVGRGDNFRWRRRVRQWIWRRHFPRHDYAQGDIGRYANRHFGHN